MQKKRLLKGGMSLSVLMTMIIVALILGILIDVIADYTIGLNNAAYATNITGPVGTLIDFVPLAMVLVVIVAYFKGIGGSK